MSELARVSISLEESLLAAFDKHIQDRGYANRSEAIRDLIRDKLIKEQAEHATADIVGVLTLVYDHHARELATKLIEKQHEHHDVVVSTLHVHLGERHCLEVTILRGPVKDVKRLANALLATRGVLHGDLLLTSSEQSFTAWSGEEQGHGHSHG